MLDHKKCSAVVCEKFRVYGKSSYIQIFYTHQRCPMNAILGQLLALLTAACFATVSNIWSFAGRRIGSNTVTHIRLWLTLPFIVSIHLLMTGTFFPKGINDTALTLFLISGLLGFTVADLFIFRSLLLIGVRETLVILTLAPIFSTVISWFLLEEILSVLQVIGILVTTGGVMWVIYEEGKIRNHVKQDKQRNLGVPFAMAGALAQALANIFSKAGMYHQVPPISGTYLRIVAGLGGLVLFSLLRKTFFEDFRKMRNIRLTLLLAAAAFIGPVLGVLLTLYALRVAPVGIVTALVQVSPILLLPYDFFVLKKKITLRVVAGTFTAIGGGAMLFIFAG